MQRSKSNNPETTPKNSGNTIPYNKTLKERNNTEVE